MISSVTKTLVLFFKVLGVGLILAIGMGLYFSPENFLKENHRPLLVVSLVLFFLVFLLLLYEYRSSTYRQQQTIEQLMGLKLALTSLIDLKDRYTEGHSRRVRDLTSAFVRYLNLDQKLCNDIALAAELHDIGKIGIKDTILNKPGSLEDFEFEAIRTHPEKGADALKTLPGLESVRLMIRHHHERFDGKGYPDQISGNGIPLGARIIALADSYDSMLHGRVYRPAMPPTQVRKALQESSGKQFDPQLTMRFFEFLNKTTISGMLDPVCGMQLDSRNTPYWIQDAGQKIAFCSLVCMRAYQESPEIFRASMNQTGADSKEMPC